MKDVEIKSYVANIEMTLQQWKDFKQLPKLKRELKAANQLIAKLQSRKEVTNDTDSNEGKASR